MKNKIFWNILITAIALILIGVCIYWSINIYWQNYTLWLNEYNTQMQQFGYYKEDIHLLNQFATQTAIRTQIVFNIISCFVVIVSSILGYFLVDSKCYEEYLRGIN